MKKQVLSAVAMLSLLVTLMMVGYAAPAGRISVNIPFDFMVGKTKLPAGQYIVQGTNTQGVLQISSTDRKANVLAVTSSGKADAGESKARLDFNRYGDQYFLSQVWEGGSTAAHRLVKSRAEREAAKRLSDHLAKNMVEPELVSILAQ